MTINEAIVFIRALKNDLRAKGMTQYPVALQLGIEALKRELRYRRDHPDVADYLLPGETEEIQ